MILLITLYIKISKLSSKILNTYTEKRFAKIFKDLTGYKF